MKLKRTFLLRLMHGLNGTKKLEMKLKTVDFQERFSQNNSLCYFKPTEGDTMTMIILLTCIFMAVIIADYYG